jgi:hypothetical protein
MFVISCSESLAVDFFVLCTLFNTASSAAHQMLSIFKRMLLKTWTSWLVFLATFSIFGILIKTVSNFFFSKTRGYFRNTGGKFDAGIVDNGGKQWEQLSNC